MRKRLRPSPALLIAVLALMVALGGTGYAAFRLPSASVGTAQLKDGAVTARKVHRHTLLASDFKPGALSRSGAPQGPRGPQGPPGQPGPSGQPGPAGSARAYGLVSAAGALDSTRSKNIAAVGHPSNGIYCLTLSGVSPASTVAVVTPNEGGGGESREIAHVDTDGPDCPSGTFEIVTRRIEFDAGTQATTAFHHDNGFSFVVP